MTEREFLSLRVGDKVAYLSKGKTYELEGKIDRVFREENSYGVVVVNPIKYVGDKVILEKNGKDIRVNDQKFFLERLVRKDKGEPTDKTYMWTCCPNRDLPMPKEKTVGADDQLKKDKGQQLFDTSADDERLDNEEKIDSSECCTLARLRFVD